VVAVLSGLLIRDFSGRTEENMTNPTAEQLMYKLRLTMEPPEYEAHVLTHTTATSVSIP